MNVSSGEAFVAGIALIGFAVMLRIVRLHAALFLIGIIALTSYILPLTGRYAGSLPTWLLAIIAIILCVSFLRGIVSILFGREVANSFTGGLMNNIMAPIFVPSVGY
ncbi:MAG: hypothetical protein ABFD82_18990 [Syntrophaceae bacterium]